MVHLFVIGLGDVCTREDIAALRRALVEAEERLQNIGARRRPHNKLRVRAGRVMM